MSKIYDTFISGSGGRPMVILPGPKGNLRPYQIAKTMVRGAAKTRNPWIIVGGLALAAITVAGLSVLGSKDN